MERALIVLLVGLLSAFVVDARPKDDEEKLEGPRGLKAFVGRTGGGIRQYREMPAGPGGKGPRKTGEIEIRLGRIREANDTTSSGQQRPPPSRPGQGTEDSTRLDLESPDNIDFNVQDRPYVYYCI